jgi:hypothetical protein
MGALMPQGPNTHCGDVGSHTAHPNPQPVAPTAWCDGVEPLDLFLELVVRVPLKELFSDNYRAYSHADVMQTMADGGVGIVADYIDEGAVTTLRVRTGDGVDRVYPVKRAVPEGQGKLW